MRFTAYRAPAQRPTSQVELPERMDSQRLSEGILAAATTPLRGEAAGWTLAFAVLGPLLTFIDFLAQPAPGLGFLVSLATGVVLYAALVHYFERCMEGVRAGKLEPASTELRGHVDARAWLGRGVAVVFWVVFWLVVIGLGWEFIVPMASGWLIWLIIALGFSVFMPAAVALMMAYNAVLGLWHIPGQMKLIRACGPYYLVPALVFFGAVTTPTQLLYWMADYGWAYEVAASAFCTLGFAVAMGATGASFGWLARNREEVDQILGAV